MFGEILDNLRRLTTWKKKEQVEDWLKQINQLDLQKIKAKTFFTLNELKRLRTRFIAMADPHTGRVPLSFLCEQPEMVLNPFLHRLLELLLDPPLPPPAAGRIRNIPPVAAASHGQQSDYDDMDDYSTINEGFLAQTDRPRRHDPSLNFLQFITLLSPLHPSAPRQVKLQVLHMALDYRGDGKLTAREMSLLLKTLFTGRVSDRSIVMMGEDIMNALDESLQDCNDGEVSIAVVMCLIGRHDLDTRLTTYF